MKKIAEEEHLSNTPTVPSNEGPWGSIAHGVSAVMNPLFVALPTLLLIALHTAPDTMHALLWWAITVIGITIAPLLFIRRGVRKGHYSDSHVSIRSQRYKPLAFAIGCVASVFTLLLILHASHALLATITSALVACVIAAMITFYWKISFHLLGVAGAVTVLVLVFGPLFFLLSSLVLLVGWARWQLHAHTLLQALAGTVLAVGVTVAIFRLF